MPLRDHFRPPWSEEHPWEGFHSAWVNTMVRHLNGSVLPPNFRAFPQIHLGPFLETDVEVPGQDIFEVRVVDTRPGMRLAAVVELVSPGNKDRPEERQAFAAKCASYLQEQVGVIILDIVSTRRANMHRELLQMLPVPPSETSIADLYCVSYRNRRNGNRWRLDTWPFALTIGSPLPTVPLWLAGVTAVPLDLESSYEKTCRVLRIE
jgi:Protein of unknown function (DUF4058)